MKISTVFTIAGVSAILGLAFMTACFIARSYRQHLDLRFKPEVEHVGFQPGDLVRIRPGAQTGVVLQESPTQVDICVEDKIGGGVKTQAVSPLILQRYGR